MRGPYVRNNFLFGRWADVMDVAERMGLSNAARMGEIRHNVCGWWLSPEQARDSKWAGAMPVTLVEQDNYFHGPRFNWASLPAEAVIAAVEGTIEKLTGGARDDIAAGESS